MVGVGAHPVCWRGWAFRDTLLHSILLARHLRTWLFLHVDLPWVRLLLQPTRMFLSVEGGCAMALERLAASSCLCISSITMHRCLIADAICQRSVTAAQPKPPLPYWTRPTALQWRRADLSNSKTVLQVVLRLYNSSLGEGAQGVKKGRREGVVATIHLTHPTVTWSFVYYCIDYCHFSSFYSFLLMFILFILFYWSTLFYFCFLSFFFFYYFCISLH